MLNFTELDVESEKVIVSRARLEEIVDYSILSTGNQIVDESVRQVVEQSFLRLTGFSNETEHLDLGEGTWKVTIAPNLAKTGVVASVMIGLLHVSGTAPLAALVLPAVLPLLVDVETIRLTVKDDLILSEMRLSERLKNGQHTPRQIYDQVGAEIQKEITYFEFLEVLEALCITGNVEKDKRSGLFEINSTKRFRMVFY